MSGNIEVKDFKVPMDAVFCEGQGCRAPVKFPVRICERCRIGMRHGARRLRELLLSLLDPNVMRLLDELAHRPQAYNSPTLALVRGAAASIAKEEDALLDVVDGWMLDAERAA